MTILFGVPPRASLSVAKGVTQSLSIILVPLQMSSGVGLTGPLCRMAEGRGGPMARIPGTAFDDVFTAARHEAETLVSPNAHGM